MKPVKIPADLQIWIEARPRHRLSHAHVQTARELGLNPRKLGKLDNHKQEPWKLPLPEFIEHLYRKHFHKDRPDEIITLEERAKRLAAKKAARKADRAKRLGETTDNFDRAREFND
jgi:hypothetical protein